MRLLSAAVVLVLLTAPAAGAELTAVGGGGVREVDFTMEVVLDGVVARVTTRQELRATGDDPVEAAYRFALPRGAAIVGLAVTLPGGKPQRGAAVDAAAAIAPAVGHDTLAIAPDLGLVRWLGDDGDTTTFELLVYPVAPDASTIVELTWVAPMSYVDGRLALRVPARGDSLGAITGTVTAKPPPGVKKLRALHAGGVLIAAGPGKAAWPFVADREVSFEVTPVLTKPVVSFATAEVDGDRGAVAVSVLRPRVEASSLDLARVMFVLDVSSSNASTEARDAMVAIVGGVLDGLPDAMVQAVVFDHDVHQVLPRFSHATDATRTALTAAIRDAAGAPGTDLVAALTAVNDLIDLASTLVVIITDGVLSTDADAETLDRTLDLGVTISAVLIAPDGRPAPDPRGTPLDAFTAAHDGQVVVLHPSEAAGRAPTLAGELASEPWLVDDVAGAHLELPDRITAGGGFVAFGWYEHGAPDAITVETDEGDLVAKRVKLPRIGALAVAADAVGDLAAIGRKLGTVTAASSLVAVDRDDELAAARLDLAARGGTFARIPPPLEGALVEPDVALLEVLEVGARYELDIAGRIRADLINPQLLPAARACFDAARVRGAAPTGTISLEIEIAAGEVIAARARSTGAAEMIACLRDAAYALTVPSYTLDDPDAIYVIRYPIEVATKGTVAVGDERGLEPIDLGDAVDQPLGDLVNRAPRR